MPISLSQEQLICSNSLSQDSIIDSNDIVINNTSFINNSTFKNVINNHNKKLSQIIIDPVDSINSDKNIDYYNLHNDYSMINELINDSDPNTYRCLCFLFLLSSFAIFAFIYKSSK